MKSRTLAMVIIALTAIFAIFAQIQTGSQKFRVHQNREASVFDSAVENPLECIEATEASQSSFDSHAVDIHKLRTHLPILEIDTTEVIPGRSGRGDDGIYHTRTTSASGETYLISGMKLFDNKNGYNTYHDEPTLEVSVKIGVRGNTSRSFEKSSYAIKLIDSDGENVNKELLGMEPNHEWVLHGPFLDKTLMRNYMAMNISGEIMDFAPDVRFCEVILGGEYIGVYLLMETVSAGNGRAIVDKPQYTKNVTGYIIELDNKKGLSDTKVNNFTKYTSVLRETAFFDIAYPGTLLLTPEIKTFIDQDVSRYEKALYSFDYDSKKYGFSTFVDVDEFVDYFILMETFLQHDTGNLSTFFYKSVNGLFKPCVWDFNNSIENVGVINEDDFFIRKFVTVQAPWFWMMVKDENFTNRIINRYHELRKNILSDDYLTTYIADTKDYLGSAIDRNYAVWGYSFDPKNMNEENKLQPDERNPKDYDDAIEIMQSTLLSRMHWLDEHIDVLRQYSHESAVKKFN